VERDSSSFKNKIRFSKINHVFFSLAWGSFWIGGFSVHILPCSTSNGSSIYVKGLGNYQVYNYVCLILGQIMVCISTVESNESQLIFEDDKVRVKQFFEAGIYTNGFFKKKHKRKLNTDAVKNFEIETCYYQNIKTEKISS
jgi:ribonuclease Z